MIGFFNSLRGKTKAYKTYKIDVKTKQRVNPKWFSSTEKMLTKMLAIIRRQN